MELLLWQHYWLYVCLLTALVVLLAAASVAVAAVLMLHGHRARYLLPELAALALAFLLYFSCSLWWWQGKIGVQPAARYALPIVVLLMFLLLRHLLQLARREYHCLHLRLHVRSISEGLDNLPMGILFAQSDGRVVLTNIAMLQFMETLCGRQYRNLHDFQHALVQFDRPDIASKRRHRGNLLFRLRDGRSLLFRCEPLSKLHGWQMTAMDVTEIDQMTMQMERQNSVLMRQAYEQKELLRTLAQTESARTLQDVTLRVHDIMGSRISMLQQLLQSPIAADVLQIIPRLDNMLQAVELDATIQPADQLTDLLTVYRNLGLKITVQGDLPHNRKRAKCFVEIIREGFNNAVVHGHASKMELQLAERRLVLSDDGIGCMDKIHFGNGLKGIAGRVREIGGRLRLETKPHFTIGIEVGRREDAEDTPIIGR